MQTSKRKTPQTSERDKGPERARILDLSRELLTGARVLSTQVLEHIVSHHGTSDDRVLEWLRADLSSLESFELDLLLAPIFTPNFETRVRFEGLLRGSSLSPKDVSWLAEMLRASDLHFELRFQDGASNIPVPDVTINRWISLLHLELDLPSHGMADRKLSPEESCLLKDRAWHRAARYKLDDALLEVAFANPSERLANVHFLTDFLRSHRPKSLDECRRFLANLLTAYEADLEQYKSGERPFFDVQLQSAYAGKWKARDQVLEEHDTAIQKTRNLLRLLS